LRQKEQFESGEKKFWASTIGIKNNKEEVKKKGKKAKQGGGLIDSRPGSRQSLLQRF